MNECYVMVQRERLALALARRSVRVQLDGERLVAALLGWAHCCYHRLLLAHLAHFGWGRLAGCCHQRYHSESE